MAGAGLVAGGYYAGKAIKGTIKGFKSIGKTMGRKPKWVYMKTLTDVKS